MEYKGGLYIFVEGPDDERFFKSVFESIFIQQFEFIKYIQYAVLPKNIVEKLVNTQKHSPKNKYIFICDMDARGDSNICITTRKEKEYDKYGKIIEKPTSEINNNGVTFKINTSLLADPTMEMIYVEIQTN